MNKALQLGGPLPIIGDVQEAIVEVRQMIQELRPRVEIALDAIPRVETNVDRITGYIPWLIAALGFLGSAIIVHAVVTRTR